MILDTIAASAKERVAVGKRSTASCRTDRQSKRVRLQYGISF